MTLYKRVEKVDQPGRPHVDVDRPRPETGSNLREESPRKSQPASDDWQ